MHSQGRRHAKKSEREIFVTSMAAAGGDRGRNALPGG